MRRPQRTGDSPYNYEVIGEHLSDPDRLLVVGDDGRYYALHLITGLTSSAEFADEWIIDTCDLRNPTQRVLRPAIAS
jgi:hypothetical protein